MPWEYIACKFGLQDIWGLFPSCEVPLQTWLLSLYGGHFILHVIWGYYAPPPKLEVGGRILSFPFSRFLYISCKKPQEEIWHFGSNTWKRRGHFTGNIRGNMGFRVVSGYFLDIKWIIRRQYASYIPLHPILGQNLDYMPVLCRQYMAYLSFPGILPVIHGLLYLNSTDFSL